MNGSPRIIEFSNVFYDLPLDSWFILDASLLSLLKTTELLRKFLNIIDSNVFTHYEISTYKIFELFHIYRLFPKPTNPSYFIWDDDTIILLSFSLRGIS